MGQVTWPSRSVHLRSLPPFAPSPFKSRDRRSRIVTEWEPRKNAADELGLSRLRIQCDRAIPYIFYFDWNSMISAQLSRQGNRLTRLRCWVVARMVDAR